MALPFLLLASDKGRVIPKKFFVVMPFGRSREYEYSAKPTKDIAAGVLDGVMGISDKAEIIMQWYGMARDAILAMDGPELVRLNSLSRIQYDNPEYLVSNGLAALYRIFDKNPAAKYGANALANNISDNIAAGLKKASRSAGVEKEAKQVSDLLIKASVALNEAMESLPEDKDDRKYLLRQAEIDQGDLEFLDRRLRKAAEYVDSFMHNAKTRISQRDIDLYLDPSDFVIGSFVGFNDNKQGFFNNAVEYGFDADQLASFQKVLDAVSMAVDAFDARNDLGDKAAELVANQSKYSGLLYAAERGDFRKAVEKAFEGGTSNIKSVKGLAKVIADAAKDSHNLRDLSLADWEAIVRQGLRHIGETYADEGEWLVKDRKLKIPPNSTLWISKYPLPEDVEARRKTGDTSKLDDFVHGSSIKANDDMDRLIKDLNLEQKYTVRRIDRKRFDEARSKWAVKPKKLAASVEKAPKEFRLLFHLPNERVPDLGEQLASGVLKGIAGITDAGPVLQLRMLSVNRNAMLIMPGQETMRLNDLRPIKYSDPESLVADDMAIAQRIMGRDFDKRKVITRILQEAEKGPMKEWTRAWQRLDIFPAVEEQMASRPVNSVHDLAEHMFELSKPKVEAAIERNKEWSSEEWINERYQPLLNIENYVKAIRSGLRGLGKTFVWEGEWLVADKTLRIPEGSRLIILNKRPEASKMVEDYGLDQRYRVQYADQKKMEQATYHLGRYADKATKERWSEE